jgi:hypothetical protein
MPVIPLAAAAAAAPASVSVSVSVSAGNTFHFYSHDFKFRHLMLANTFPRFLFLFVSRCDHKHVWRLSGAFS